MPIAQMVILRQLFEPDIRLMDRVVKRRHLGIAHGLNLALETASSSNADS
jgi:hypothetical protein